MTQLLSAYQFVPLTQMPLQRERIRARAVELGLKGTVLIAEEGINFSLGGERVALDRFLTWADQRLGLDAPVVNWQPVDRVPFLRLKVRIRPEIITFDPELIPGEVPTGLALSPNQWHELIARDDVQLVDTRNQYEYELGTFEGAVDPATERFTEFGDWALEHLAPEQPVAMFCTGGVRCEKASAWLLKHGYSKVYQLDGGILNYLRTIPEAESRWQGECFVFDDRVSVDHSLQPTGRSVCAGCRRPAEGLEPEAMPPVDGDGQCRLCSERFDPARLSGLRERVRQIALAQSRGELHLGPQIEESDA
ncbi:MAG: rhodanese-like domain-containing protein [Pseudomonadota bacterium]